VGAEILKRHLFLLSKNLGVTLRDLNFLKGEYFMLQNFRTYNLAKEFYKDCEKVSCKAHIRDQLLRASLSVVLNLAEGSGVF